MVTSNNVKLDNLFKRCDPTIGLGPMPDQLKEFKTLVACVFSRLILTVKWC